jgi:hypothetical protein
MRRTQHDVFAKATTPRYIVVWSMQCGFVFMRRGADRRLLTLTPRDPHDATAQSFNPFRDTDGAC